jgi:WD40 repeat protein
MTFRRFAAVALLLGWCGPLPAAPPAAAGPAADAPPPGALLRLGTLRMRHGSEVLAVAVSPDGKLLAVSGDDDRVRLLSTADGRMVREFTDVGGPVGDLAFLPDGRRLLIGGPTPAIWDVETGRTVEFKTEQPQMSAALSPDGRRVATSAPGEPVRVWDAATGKVIASLPAVPDQMRTPVFSPDGKTLALLNPDAGVTLVETAGGKEIRTLGNSENAPVRAAFSPDGKRLIAAGNAGRVQVWDVADGTSAAEWESHEEFPAGLAVSPDGKRMALAGESAVRMWDLESQRKMWEVPHSGPGAAASVAFGRDGARLAVGCGRRVRLLDPATGKDLLPTGGHGDGINSIAWSPDGRRVLTAADDGMVLWDAATGAEVRAFPDRHAAGVLAAFWSADGLRVGVVSGAGAVTFRDAATGRPAGRTEFGDGEFAQLALSPAAGTAALLTGAENDLTLRVKVLSTGRTIAERGRIKVADEGCRFAASADGRLLALHNSGDGLVLLDGRTGREVVRRRPAREDEFLVAIAFSADCSMVAAADGATVRIWETGGLRELAAITVADGNAETLTFSPDGRRLAGAGGDGVARVWDTSTGEAVVALGAPGRDRAGALAFSPDGGRLAVGRDDTTAVIWPLPAPKIRKLSDRQREKAWADLAGDAASAHRATAALADDDPAGVVAFLSARVKPAAASPEDRRVSELVAALDSDSYGERETAQAELSKMGAAVEPLLRSALARGVPPEAEVRIRSLLSKLAARPPVSSDPELRRLQSAVRVLERAGSPDARRLLGVLAGGAIGTEPTEAAAAALQRPGR